MNIKLTLSIIISKIVLIGCRLFRLGGTTLPGKIALRIYPDILAQLSGNYKIIMVTGTNGKTTTTRIIGRILLENDIKYISNTSGANLIGGITTTFVKASNIFGKSKVNTALFEVDEGVFHVICRHIKPDILVVTNFFRDQLDRYGELHNTIKSVSAGIKQSKDVILVLNADDSLSSSLGKDINRKIVYYGISQYALQDNHQYGNIDENAGKDINMDTNIDAAFCFFCKSRYSFSYRTYGHLGGFTCQECGYSHPDTQVTCNKIYELNNSDSVAEFSFQNENGSKTSAIARINLPGIYNVYNALAAAACGHALGLSPANTVDALGSFAPGFGRMETISAGGKNITLIMVKNPAGFSQALSLLDTQSQNIQSNNINNVQIAFIINDHTGDGADISWLWDVNFEKFRYIQHLISNIYTSGTRAEDMALRLKYAGADISKSNIIKDYNCLLETGLSGIKENGTFYIYATYTAILEIRKALKKKYMLKEF